MKNATPDRLVPASRADRKATARKKHGAERIRPFIAVAAILVVGGVVVALRTAGLLQGPSALALAGLLFLTVPTAKVLSQRILFNGLIGTGLVPLFWWIPERLLGLDHGTLLLATVAGLMAGWLLCKRSIQARLHRLVPQIRFIDALPVLAAVLSALSLSTMLTIRNSADALSIMMSRWDYNSHFSIYHMIRSNGGVIPTIPLSADGASWGFSEYPQSFHALIATAAQILRPTALSLDSELVSFINLQAACSVLVVLIVVAGICAHPAVRRRQAIMAPGIAVAAAAWIFGPGSIPVYEGFANFYLACGVATAVVLAILTFQRLVPLVGVAAVGAGLVGISNNWLLLLSLVAVILVTAFWAIARHPRNYTGRWWTLTVAIACVTLVGVALPVLQLAPLISSSQAILEASGGIKRPDFGVALLTLAMALTLGTCNWSMVAGTELRCLRRQRVGVSIATAGLLVPLALGAWLAITQSSENGEISYYFFKYLIAVLLLAWPLSVVAAATLIPIQPRSGSVRHRVVRSSALVLLAVTATQAFGFSVAGLQGIGLPPTARPVVELASQAEHLKSTPAYAGRLIASARARAPESPLTVYVPAEGTVDPVLAARWHWGMRGIASSITTNLSFQLVEIAKDYTQAPRVISLILAEHPAMNAVVDPELYPAVHAYLLEHGDASRVSVVN